MRLLKRGTRGADVRDWQAFLLGLRTRAQPRVQVPAIRVDGIFGGGTARATVALQQRFGLKPDGVVGPRTLAKAESLGFKAASKDAVAEPARMAAPASTSGNTREASFQRLRAEGWTNSGAVVHGLNGGNAVLQSVEDGSGDYVYDEYSILVEKLGSNDSPESLVLALATDLNGTIKDKTFDAINVFRRARAGPPMVGELVHIDIMGPDDGSVILAELTPDYFIYQTIDCEETGSHPENGSREFGCQREGARVRFYTRGVSRPGNVVIRVAGAGPQMVGWTRLMRGLSDQIAARGGQPVPGSFRMHKETRAN